MKGLRDCALVVDDEAIIAELWCLILDGMGVEVCGVAPTAEDALALAELHRPKVVLMDFRLKGQQDGVDAALAIGRTMRSRVIFITGSQEPSTVERIHLCQPSAVLFKPVSEQDFRDAVKDAFQPP